MKKHLRGGPQPSGEPAAEEALGEEATLYEHLDMARTQSTPSLEGAHGPPSSDGVGSGLDVLVAFEPESRPALDAIDESLEETTAWRAARLPGTQALLGKVVAGRYRLVRVLGAGGMGTVYQAEHTDLGKQVAIKVLAATLDENGEATERFLREAKAASTIESEHIAQVFDVGEDFHLGLYMVMELLKGEDVAAAIAARGRLRAETAAGIAWQVCLALERAHDAGVVHRDLKPANVFLTRGDDGSVKVKVLDFGIAKLLRDARMARGRAGRPITRSGLVVGTPQYMSPEQAQGLSTIDHRTDVYSLGALLFEAVTGAPPFPELETYEQTLFKILSEDAPRLSSKAPDVPPALDELVARMMAREPAMRPGSVRDIRGRLALIFPSLGRRTLGFGGSTPASNASPVALPQSGSGVIVDSKMSVPAPAPRRVRPRTLIAMGALLGTAVAVASLALRSSNGTEGLAKSEPSQTVAAATQPPAETAIPAPPPTGVTFLLAADQRAATLVSRAQGALERGDAAQARDLATEATRQSPTSSEAWLTLGAAHEALGDRPSARAAYESCRDQVAGERARECVALLAR